MKQIVLILFFISAAFAQLPKPGGAGGGGGSGSTTTFGDAWTIGETPSGTINGSNVTFTLAAVPASSAKLKVYVNGQLLKLTTDYSLSGSTLTMVTAPPNGATLLVDYVTTIAVTAPYECSVSAASSVACTHNLNTTKPWVTCYDSSNRMLGSTGTATSVTSVVGTSASVATITFSGSTTATCVISTGGVGPTGATGAEGPAGSDPTTTRGDLIRRGASAIERLPLGTSGYPVVSDGTDAVYAQLGTAGIADNAVTRAKVSAVLRTRQFTFILGADNGSVLADTDDQPSIWINRLGSGVTITEVHCESDGGTPAINLQRDDGSAANILTGNLSCSTSGATGTIDTNEDNVANAEKVDFVMATAGGTAKRITVTILYTLD